MKKIFFGVLFSVFFLVKPTFAATTVGNTTGSQAWIVGTTGNTCEIPFGTCSGSPAYKGVEAAGQFIETPGSDTAVDYVEVHIDPNNPLEGNYVWLEIRDQDASIPSLPGQLLFSSTEIPRATFTSTDAAWYQFDFPQQPKLLPGKKYWYVIETDDFAAANTIGYNLTSDSTNPYTDGYSAYRLDNGSWAYVAASGHDLKLTVTFDGHDGETSALDGTPTDYFVGSGDVPGYIYDRYGNKMDLSDWVDLYPDQATVYGSCDLWGSSTGDGLPCIWSWVKYILVPQTEPFGDLLRAPMETLRTRWPVTYLTVLPQAFLFGLNNPYEYCYLPQIPEITILGITNPGFNTCTILTNADYPDLIDGVPALKDLIIVSIYGAFALLWLKLALRFLKIEK